MKTPAHGFSVGVAGAASLLGKELLAVLKERDFPVARMVTAEDEEAEPDMPVVDLREGFQPAIAEENLAEKDFDVVFVAAPLKARGEKSHAAPGPPFLRSPDQLARAARCTVIDLCDGLADQPGGVVRVPFLEYAGALSRPSEPARPGGYYVSAHPATIVLAALLSRLAARFTLTAAVAEVFFPASEIGPPAVDELQRQTSSLLTFQKLPQSVFGRQLAFNLLPRYGSAKATALEAIESRIHRQLGAYLGGRVIPPAVRVVQAPVFHALALLLYVETSGPAPVETLEQALKGPRVALTRLREPAPSQAEASGSTDILVDAVARDSSRAQGAWIWAVADNLRLAALNATEIAEVARQPVRAQGGEC
jgi:aspartate-semialdehyde dehydrogenase